MNDKELAKSEGEKDLGVLIDRDMNFNDHVTAITKKANKISGMITHNIINKHKCIMIPLFKALVRPILEYANVVWCPALKTNIDKIEGVQRRFTKKIKGLNKLNYVERLRALKLPSLEYRRKRGDLIEMYKIVQGINDPCTTTSLYNICENACTRGHDFKLVKPAVNTNKYANFFTNRVINPWNQ